MKVSVLVWGLGFLRVVRAEEIDLIMSKTLAACWDYLDAPPVRVTGADIPMPYAENLESEEAEHLLSH